MRRLRGSNVVKKRRAEIKWIIFGKKPDAAVEELKDIKAGRKQGRPVEELLKELREIK